MKSPHLIALLVLVSTSTFAQKTNKAFQPNREREKVIMNMLKRGYDAWYSDDHSVYPESYADKISYFDPATGQKFMQTKQQLIEHFKKVNSSGTYSEPTNVTFQHYKDITILTFNFSQTINGNTLWWNVTEVYHKIGKDWKVVHGHYSFMGNE